MEETMAFYKVADDDRQRYWAVYSEDVAVTIKEKLKETRTYDRATEAMSDLLDPDSIDVRIEENMRSVHVFECDRCGESVYVRFNFTMPIDLVYLDEFGCENDYFRSGVHEERRASGR